MQVNTNFLCPNCLESVNVDVKTEHPTCPNCQSNLRDFFPNEKEANKLLQLIEKVALIITAIIFGFLCLYGFVFFTVPSLLVQKVFGPGSIVFGSVLGPLSLFALNRSISVGPRKLIKQYGHHSWLYLVGMIVGMTLAIWFWLELKDPNPTVSGFALLLGVVSLIALRHSALLIYYLVFASGE